MRFFRLWRAILSSLIALVLGASALLGASSSSSSADDRSFVDIPEPDIGATLEHLAGQMSSNYERIRTWKGTYHFQDTQLLEGELAQLLRKDIEGQPDDDPSPLIKTESCRGEFVIDLKSDLLFTTFQRTQPAQFVDQLSGKKLGPRMHHDEGYERHVATAEHHLYLQPNENYGALRVYPHWPVRRGPAAFRKPASTGRNDEFGQIIDPRRYMWLGEPFGTHFGFFAEKLQQPDSRDSARRIFKMAKYENTNCVIFRLIVAERDEYLFDSNVGFNPVFLRLGHANGARTERNYEYREVSGVFVTSRIVLTTFANDGQTIVFRRDWTLEDTQVNKPLAPETFTYANLGVQDGNRVVDEIENVGYVYRDGQLTDPVRFEEVVGRPPPPPERDGEQRGWGKVRFVVSVITVLLMAAYLLLLAIRWKRRRGAA